MTFQIWIQGQSLYRPSLQTKVPESQEKKDVLQHQGFIVFS